MLVNRDHVAQEFSRVLSAYLAGVLHQKIELGDWSGYNQLPSFLASTYAYFQTTIGNHACLFMAAVDDEDATAVEISKRIAAVQRVFHGIVAYAVLRLSSHQRARLISHGVAFVVPGNQLYIPQLAMDLREHFRARKTVRQGAHLSPVAQAVLFHHILARNPRLTTPSTLSDALKYSPMSIGRAFEELVSLQLARITIDGREKHLAFDRTPTDLIEAARPYLRSPVRKSYYVRETPTMRGLKLAGETALAELCSLAPPAIQVFATSSDNYKAILASQSLEQVKYEDEANAVIEIWRYDPGILSDSPVVDVLSLYAQFWNQSNERIAAAAAEPLEQLGWLPPPGGLLEFVRSR